MKKYEIMFIVKSTISEDEVKATVEKFKGILTSNGAKIVDFVEMGQRELAYEIKKCSNGFYFVATVEANDDAAIKEFDRLSLISGDVLRHLITVAN